MKSDESAEICFGIDFYSAANVHRGCQSADPGGLRAASWNDLRVSEWSEGVRWWDQQRDKIAKFFDHGIGLDDS